MAVLHGLNPGETLVSKGQYTVTVVKGAIRILGAVIVASKVAAQKKIDTHYVCVPERFPAPIVECVPFTYDYEDEDKITEGETDFDKLAQHPRVGKIPSDYGAEYLKLCSRYPTVVRLDGNLTGLENIADLAPVYSKLWSSGAHLSSSTSERVFDCIYTPSACEVYRQFRSWYETAADIGDTRKPSGVFVSMIVGNKGSGKSTFCRFLTNYLVSKNSVTVYYLELDPGQPETGCPGTLTLVEKTRPSFSPAFALDPFISSRVIKSHSLGATSPVDSPEYYLRCVKDLVGLFEKCISSPVPQTTKKKTILVINTCGWTKGLGLDLLDNIAKISSPDLVVNMGEEIAEFSDKFSSEQYHVIESTSGGIITPLEAGVSTGSTEEFTPADARAVRFMSYFHGADKYTVPLTHKPPRLVSYDGNQSAFSVKAVAMIGGEGIDSRDAVRAINGTLVSVMAIKKGLLTTPGKTISSRPKIDVTINPEGDNIPWISASGVSSLLGDPTIMKCVGYALVQSIDSKAKQFRLVTPIESRELQSALFDGQTQVCDLILLRGRLSLTVWDMWHQSGDPSKQPYLATESIGEGGDVLRVRRNIQR